MFYLVMVTGSPTVAGNNEEFVILVDIVYFDVGERCDYLLLRRKIGALLELEIAYRTRQSKVTVDSAEVDKAASSLDTCLFGWGLSVQPTMQGLDFLPSF